MTVASVREGAAETARLAAASCGMAWAGVSVLTTSGLRAEVVHGLTPPAPAPLAELCEQVLRDGGFVVRDGGGAGVGTFVGTPIATTDGDLLGVLWVADDAPGRSVEGLPQQWLTVLADRLALDWELVDLRRERTQALDMVGAVIFYASRDGVVTGVSSSWTALTGHSADATVGRRLTEFVPGDGAGPVEGALTGRELDSVHRLDCALLSADGVAIPVEIAVTRSDRVCGGEYHLLGLVVDQRERHRRELEARHDQKLESLGRLSAGIAHEINTPIQFVGDNTRFLAEAYQDMLELLLIYRECLDGSAGELAWEARKERAEEAERQADIAYLAAEVPAAVEQSLEGIDRVASLVRAMKAFSYKDSRDRSYADLNEALTTTLTVARNEVKYVADVTCDFGELPQVLCHVGDLNQVFLNLVVNAADAMQDKGERGEIRIRTRVDGPMVVISVADNGSGIPPELQRLVFEPFFTTKEVGKGTGQGLPLARAVVVDKHGGTIDVSSAPGEGTEFVLRLPIDGKRTAAA
jgi:PAS domain S-box-containing protein